MDELITIPTKHDTPRVSDLLAALERTDCGDNISVYDAKSDEYFPVKFIKRASEENDVLDPGHLVLVIE